LDELLNWCQTNSDVPEDKDEPFVVSFESKTKSNNKIKYLRILMSTLRLLELTKHSK
jgi:hypothetical protein